MVGGTPEWVIREDAGQPVILALYLRQVLGIRSPDELPHLRGIPPRVNDRDEQTQALLRMLAFWTGRDAAQMDRLFRGSRVMSDIVS